MKDSFLTGKHSLMSNRSLEFAHLLYSDPLSLHTPGGDIAIWPNYLSLAASVITGAFTAPAPPFHIGGDFN